MKNIDQLALLAIENILQKIDKNDLKYEELIRQQQEILEKYQKQNKNLENL